MEKKVEKEEVQHRIEGSIELYRAMFKLFEKENAKNSEIVFSCIGAITCACENSLIMPPQKFFDMLVQIIDFHIKEKVE